MKTILVTGAGGYIGSTLSATLLDAGYRVIGLDRYFFGTEFLKDLFANPCFTPIKKDIRDLTAADFEGVDGVCDLAALSNDPSGDLDPGSHLLHQPPRPPGSRPGSQRGRCDQIRAREQLFGVRSGTKAGMTCVEGMPS